jgi:hypothetical protein
MTSIHYEATYPAAVERVIGVLTDEAFLSAYAQEVGALAHSVEIGSAGPDYQVQTRVTMTVPTAGVPAALKRLVTPTVDITEVRLWTEGEGRWGGRLAVDASARGRHARVRGDLVLEPGKNGSAKDGTAASRFGVDGTVRVAVPLLGDLAAGLVKDLVGSVIKRQSAVMERWLREG